VSFTRANGRTSLAGAFFGLEERPQRAARETHNRPHDTGISAMKNRTMKNRKRMMMKKAKMNKKRRMSGKKRMTRRYTKRMTTRKTGMKRTTARNGARRRMTRKTRRSGFKRTMKTYKNYSFFAYRTSKRKAA
jgi:hypothetical protein